MSKITFSLLIILGCWKIAALPMDPMDGVKQEALSRPAVQETANSSSSETEQRSLQNLSVREENDVDPMLVDFNDHPDLVAGTGNQNIKEGEPPTEPLFITKFRNLMQPLQVPDEIIPNLHTCLKNLQQRPHPTSYAEGQIFWNNTEQQFVGYPQIGGADLSNELQDAIQTLKDYVTYERGLRRADRYTLTDQDRNDPRLLNVLLSPTLNLNRLSLAIVHQNEVVEFHPSEQQLTVTAAVEAVAIDPTPQQTILLFGFNVPKMSGPRIEIKKILAENFPFIVSQAMNDYNKALGMGVGGGMKFNEYLTFIDHLKKKTLYNQITAATLQHTNKEKDVMTREQAHAWAAFLIDRIERFNFSLKLPTSLEEPTLLEDLIKQARFIAKNYKSLRKPLTGVEDPTNLNLDNLAKICGYLKPALKLLADVGTILISPTFGAPEDLNIAALETARVALEDQYQFPMVTEPRRKDLQKFLDSVLTEAFFRKTSKLGLEFAQESKKKVAFVYKLPSSFHSALTTLTPQEQLKQLYKYVERKPYYHFNFRIYMGDKGDEMKAPEAVTGSEIRHLGRLMMRVDPNSPDYLLIRDIFLLVHSSGVSDAAIE